jgi:phosphate transport system permease protein
MLSLPLFAFTQMKMPLDTAIARAFGSSVVLLVLVVVLFGLARILGGRPPGHVSRRKQRRLAAARLRRTESEPSR